MNNICKKYFDKYQNLSIGELVNLDNRILNTLMLEIYQQKSEKINCRDVLEKYISNYEFFCPSKSDLRVINKYNQIFLDCLPEKYEALELSPIVPFGGNSSFTNLSQKNILTSIKNSEVCSDATTALTLEACKRRKKMYNNLDFINEEVNLATIKKVLRMQRFDKEKGYLQHFNQFAIVTAGRKNTNFEYEKLKEHIELWLNVLLKLKKNNFSLGNLNVGLCHINIIEHFIKKNFIDKNIITKNSFSDFDLFHELGIKLPTKITDYSDLKKEEIKYYKLDLIKIYIDYLSGIIGYLSNKYPSVNFYIELDRKGGLGYYVGACFHIYSEEKGNFIPLCDGGIPNWNSKILCDNKEISITSGIGAELILNLYKRK